MPGISVLISDDHAVVRHALAALLAKAPGVELVGEADNGHRAVAEAKRLMPDVILMDLAMPILNGLEATRQITTAIRTVRVLAFSAHADDRYVHQAMQAGASGYLLKQATRDELLQAIRQVHEGHAWFSPPIAGRLVRLWEEKHLRGGAARIVSNELTSRQTEILQLVAEGFSTKEIAGLLSISVNTVESHRHQAMERLGIHDIASLTRYAVSRGVVESRSL